LPSRTPKQSNTPQAAIYGIIAALVIVAIIAVVLVLKKKTKKAKLKEAPAKK